MERVMLAVVFTGGSAGELAFEVLFDGEGQLLWSLSAWTPLAFLAWPCRYLIASSMVRCSMKRKHWVRLFFYRFGGTMPLFLKFIIF